MRYTLLVTFGVLLLAGGCATRPPAEPVFGPTNPTVEAQLDAGVVYYGSVIEVVPEKERLYRELHADVWPEVLAAIEKANIRNYNIFIAELDGTRYLFSFFEYHGTDPDRDFATIAQDPVTRDKWWPITDGCQRRLPGTPEGSQWKSIEMLMHID